MDGDRLVRRFFERERELDANSTSGDSRPGTSATRSGSSTVVSSTFEHSQTNEAVAIPPSPVENSPADPTNPRYARRGSRGETVIYSIDTVSVPKRPCPNRSTRASRCVTGA